MTFERSGLQVHDLNELDTLGLLDIAIENASMRRDSSPAAVAQTEADQVHGGMLASVIIAGYFPITPIPGLGPLSPKLNDQQSFI